jgi:hypothetical protein
VQVQKSNGNNTVLIPVGASEVLIKCEAADGSASMTVVKVTRPSPSDSWLKALDLSTGVLRPEFHKDEFNYTLYVASTISTVQIYPKAMDSKAVITMDNPDMLNPGDTCLKCTAQSQDATSKTVYNLTIRKGGTMEYSNHGYLNFILYR